MAKLSENLAGSFQRLLGLSRISCDVEEYGGIGEINAALL